MLYPAVKILIRMALTLFCRRISFNNRSVLQHEGPLLLACNHPNSFLDAMIVGSQFDGTVHFLARGDAFRKPIARKILSALNLIPIYRLSEGREFLALNDATFEQCRQVLLANGKVLIFSEGLCLHQWLLRPLKKGTARIALDAWSQPAIAAQFSVLPVSLNYNSFKGFGKRLIIHFGDPINNADLPAMHSEGELINQFNTMLSVRLRQGMLESFSGENIVQALITNHSSLQSPGTELIPLLQQKQREGVDMGMQNELVKTNPPYVLSHALFQRIVDIVLVIALFIPAIAGWILHAPLSVSIKSVVSRKTKGTVFFDSVLFGLLMLLYPLYWLILFSIGMVLAGSLYVKLVFFFLPVLAWLYLVWKDCVQGVANYYSLSANGRKMSRRIFH